MRNAEMNARGCALLLVLMSIPLVAPAADGADAFAKQMHACTTIPHPGERLSCYDRVAAAQPAWSESDSAAAQAQSFGLLLGSQPVPPQARGSELESITAKVRSSRRDSKRILFVTLDNGQVWRINSRDPLLRPGDAVTIRRAVAGSFTMTVPSRRPVKVRRES
jgi:hypothetical protein